MQFSFKSTIERELQLVISGRGATINTTGLEVHLNSVAPTGSNYVNRYFGRNWQPGQ